MVPLTTVYYDLDPTRLISQNTSHPGAALLAWVLFRATEFMLMLPFQMAIIKAFEEARSLLGSLITNTTMPQLGLWSIQIKITLLIKKRFFVVVVFFLVTAIHSMTQKQRIKQTNKKSSADARNNIASFLGPLWQYCHRAKHQQDCPLLIPCYSVICLSPSFRRLRQNPCGPPHNLDVYGGVWFRVPSF